MVRLVVLYPNKPGAKFDLKYYTETHLKLVREKLKPFGLVRIDADKGVSGSTPDAPAPFVVMAMLLFNSIDDLKKGLGAHGEELRADIANFTDIKPERQVNEVVS